MLPYPTGPSREHPRRLVILGGYVIDDDTCCAWGSRIAGKVFPPEKVYVAHSAIVYKLRKEYKTKFTGVGEDFESGEWMVVTQSAKFDGWKDMHLR